MFKMTKQLKWIVFLFSICLLTGCVNWDFPFPEEGIWYCDDLQIYLDFSNHNNGRMKTADGKWEKVYFQVGYGRDIHVLWEGHEDPVTKTDIMLLSGLYWYYRNQKVFVVTELNTGKKYEFIPLSEKPITW